MEPANFPTNALVALTKGLKEMQQLVLEFHETFGHPVNDWDIERLPLRIGLIAEEFVELLEDGIDMYDPTAAGDVAIILRDYNDALARAVALGDASVNRVMVADALGDMIYVIYGMAIEMGIDLEAVVQEIHRSNMSKLGADGGPIYRDDGKVMKGPNYFKPDLQKVLDVDPRF